jgi:hypothetical protein
MGKFTLTLHPVSSQSCHPYSQNTPYINHGNPLDNNATSTNTNMARNTRLTTNISTSTNMHTERLSLSLSDAGTNMRTDISARIDIGVKARIHTDMGADRRANGRTDTDARGIHCFPEASVCTSVGADICSNVRSNVGIAADIDSGTYTGAGPDADEGGSCSC